MSHIIKEVPPSLQELELNAKATNKPICISIWPSVCISCWKLGEEGLLDRQVYCVFVTVSRDEYFFDDPKIQNSAFLNES